MMQRKIDIKNELSAISQTVDNLPRENPFSVPTDYFEKFSIPLIQIPQLEQLPKDNVFQIPEGYFQQFKVRRPETRKISFFKTNEFIRYAAAACITGVLVALFFLIDNSRKQESTFEASTIRQSGFSNDAVEIYLNDAEHMSVETHADELAESQMNALVDLNSEMVGQLLSELSENGLTQFMNLNEINENKSSYN